MDGPIEYPMLGKRGPLSGNEGIGCDGASVACVKDYWQWAHSDLNSNAERGKYAEFLVACALGCTDGTSLEWGSYDLLWARGASGDRDVKVEVKCSAYVQTWGQKRLSKVLFGIRPTLAWNPLDGSSSTEAMRQADVYVFCVETFRGAEGLPNPLDLAEWEFYAVPTSTLDRELGAQKSIGLERLRGLGAKSVRWGELRDAVSIAARENEHPAS